MSENERKSLTLNLSSSFWETLLLVVAVALIFVGPTYFVLILWRGLDIDYVLSISSGMLLLVVGFLLLFFLIKKKIVS